jgi:hypothetical protein
MFDDFLGRWFVIDPLAEKYYSISSYVFCGNNPLKYIDPNGMYFDVANDKKATKIENKAERKATKLEKKADKFDAKGKSTSDLRERAAELRGSAQDIRDMRSDKTTEYKYSKASSKDNPAGKGLPVTTPTGTNSKGDNVVTMFTESNMGNKLHESRHGGQNARSEFNVVTGANYGVADEVSAYQAQYSWSGKLQHIPYTDFNNQNNMLQLLTGGIQSFIQKITNINQITPAIINTMVDNPGVKQWLIYPPSGIPLNIWNSN